MSRSSSGSVTLWDLQGFGQICNLGDYPIFLFSPDSRLILTLPGTGGDFAKLWDAEEGREIASVESNLFMIESLFAYSADRRRVAVSDMFAVSVWELGAWWELAKTSSFKPKRLGSVQRNEKVRAIALSTDGSVVASGWDDGLLTVANSESDEILATLEGQLEAVLTCAFSADGRELASGSLDYTIRLWRTDSWQPKAVLRSHSHYVESCMYSTRDNLLISGSADGVIKVWDNPGSTETTRYAAHTEPVKSCAYSPDGGRLLSASIDKTLKIWDSQTGELVTTLGGHADDLRAMALLMGSDLHQRATEEYAGQVFSGAYSPDGGWLASGTKEGLYLWEVSTEEPEFLAGHSRDVNTCAFSPDGRWLASGSDDGTLRVWDLSTRREVACLSPESRLGDRSLNSANITKSEDYNVTACAFSPDGARLLALVTCRYTESAGEGGPPGSSTRIERLATIWTTRRWSEETTRRVDDEFQRTSWVGERGCGYSADGRNIVLGRACLSSDGGSRIAIGGAWDASVWSADLGSRLAAFRANDDGEVVMRNTLRGEELVRFVTVGYNVVLAQHPTGLNLAAGDNAGRLYILALEGVEPGTPFITATRLFDIATRQWDRGVTARCARCGNRFTPSPRLLDRIHSLSEDFGASSGRSPCLQLPREAWEDASLLSKCPGCGQAIRFNPFVVDNSGARQTRTTTVHASTPHPRANAEVAAQVNIAYQQELARWKALPWLKRIRIKRPEPPRGI